jgi:hypothetical protein
MLRGDEMHLTIEPFIDTHFNGFAVYQHGVYPDHSVLAGQTRRSLVEMYESLDDARANYPDADVLDHSTKVARGDSLAEMSGLPACPPGWFDAADAGESWDADY